MSGGQTVDAQCGRLAQQHLEGEEERTLGLPTITARYRAKLIPRFEVPVCPKSPDWDSDFDVRSDEDEMNEYVMENVRHVIEGHHWELVRAFLVLR